MATTTFKTKGKIITVDIEDNIPEALQELSKLTGKTDDELLLKAGVEGCKIAAGTAPKAALGRFPMGAAANPQKGGKGRKGSQGRFYYAMFSEPGRKGTPLSLAMRGKKGRKLGYSRRRSSSGYGRGGFIGAWEELSKAASSRGIRLPKPRKKISALPRRESEGKASLGKLIKAVEISNSTRPIREGPSGEFQQALEKAVKVGLSQYLFNARIKYAGHAKAISAE